MHGLRKILREIHRRSLWQVLAIYLIGSWAVLEAVEAVTRFAGLPEWTPVFALVLLLVGLPVVTITAFIQGGLANRGGGYRDEVDPNELEGRTPDQVHVKPKARRRRRERIFTWRNAVLGGVGAGTLLVASVIAYVGMWAAGVGPMGNLMAQGVLSPGDVVVLADFRDATGQELGAVVTQALLVDLSQTRMLRVVSEPLSPDLVLEAAGRRGIKAVLEGEVAPEDDGYRLTAALRDVRSGRTLASFSSVARTPDDVIRAVGRLSRDIREKCGESRRDMRADLRSR